jgi:lipoprotein-anchoring transpeptidase ErfK/SrfK
MSRLHAAAAALLLLAAAASGCTGSSGEPAPASAPDDLATAALAHLEAEAERPPPRPRREIVPDVEVLINAPGGRLELIVGDSLVRAYPVSVGSAQYPTPIGDYLLATVVWNPWWHPPPESGWARGRRPEPPGPGNPMGRVKLHMTELIFIHGTSAEGRLGAPASHGCIRMSNADVVDLAKRLHRYADPDGDPARLDSLSTPGRQERRTVMARSVRVRVTYDVARVRDGKIHVYPDVYGRAADDYAARVRRALAGAGVDTAQVPPAAMARLRQSASRGGASFALADVPSLRPLPPEPPRQTGPRLLGRPVDAPAEAEAQRDTAVDLEPEREVPSAEAGSDVDVDPVAGDAAR